MTLSLVFIQECNFWTNPAECLLTFRLFSLPFKNKQNYKKTKQTNKQKTIHRYIPFPVYVFFFLLYWICFSHLKFYLASSHDVTERLKGLFSIYQFHTLDLLSCMLIKTLKFITFYYKAKNPTHLLLMYSLIPHLELVLLTALDLGNQSMFAKLSLPGFKVVDSSKFPTCDTT